MLDFFNKVHNIFLKQLHIFGNKCLILNTAWVEKLNLSNIQSITDPTMSPVCGCYYCMNISYSIQYSFSFYLQPSTMPILFANLHVKRGTVIVYMLGCFSCDCVALTCFRMRTHFPYVQTMCQAYNASRWHCSIVWITLCLSWLSLLSGPLP